MRAHDCQKTLPPRVQPPPHIIVRGTASRCVLCVRRAHESYFTPTPGAPPTARQRLSSLVLTLRSRARAPISRPTLYKLKRECVSRCVCARWEGDLHVINARKRVSRCTHAKERLIRSVDRIVHLVDIRPGLTQR